MAELKHCSGADGCEGPSLIKGHRHVAGADCDNDHCWVPCEHCITDAAQEAVYHKTLKALAETIQNKHPELAQAIRDLP